MASEKKTARKPILKACTQEALEWKSASRPSTPESKSHKLKIVEFLRQRPNGLELLTGHPFFLNLRRHSKYKNLVLFHYQQTVSNLNNPIVREARGTVLDQDQDWEPVCLPYLKFDNFTPQQFPELLEARQPLVEFKPKGAACQSKKQAQKAEKAENWLEKKTSQMETPTSRQLDWKTDVAVFEKFDGTLINLYFACGEYHVGTSNFPSGTNPVFGAGGQASHTFAELFWSVWAECGYPPKDTLPTNYCFMFELLTPETRVIVPLSGRRLILHGARNMDTLEEESAQVHGEKLGLTTASPLPFNSMKEVLEHSQALSPAEGEGFVVLFGDWQRCKVKAPAYVATAHLPKSEDGWKRATEAAASDSLNEARLLEIAKLGESAEFSAAFPLVAARLSHVVAQWEAFVQECESVYSRLFYAGEDAKEAAKTAPAAAAGSLEGEIWKRAASEGVEKFVVSTLMNVFKSGTHDVRSALARVESKQLVKFVMKEKSQGTKCVGSNKSVGSGGAAAVEEGGDEDERQRGGSRKKGKSKSQKAEAETASLKEREERANEIMLQLIAEEEQEESRRKAKRGTKAKSPRKSKTSS